MRSLLAPFSKTWFASRSLLRRLLGSRRRESLKEGGGGVKQAVVTGEIGAEMGH